MRGKILSIVKELEFVTLDDIRLILGDVKKKTLEENFNALEKKRDLLKLRPEENSLSKEGFIPGPNLEADEDLELRKTLAAEGLNKRHDIVDWDSLSKRLIEDLTIEIQELKENIGQLHEDPKNLEMQYFDLSLKYHGIYRLLYENYDSGILNPIYILLQECKSYLDKLEYREAP
ncbi:MAG: hypothetical protein V3T58_03410 [Candidatus Hydrothermarchaeales archaeon]